MKAIINKLMRSRCSLFLFACVHVRISSVSGSNKIGDWSPFIDRAVDVPSHAKDDQSQQTANV
jgi:hypothetical protein